MPYVIVGHTTQLCPSAWSLASTVHRFTDGKSKSAVEQRAASGTAGAHMGCDRHTSCLATLTGNGHRIPTRTPALAPACQSTYTQPATGNHRNNGLQGILTTLFPRGKGSASFPRDSVVLRCSSQAGACTYDIATLDVHYKYNARL